jgi:hypothetical protein
VPGNYERGEPAKALRAGLVILDMGTASTSAGPPFGEWRSARKAATNAMGPPLQTAYATPVPPSRPKKAIAAARATIAADALTGVIDLTDRIEVEDENGRPVLVLPFRAAVRIEGLPEHEDRPSRSEPRR